MKNDDSASNVLFLFNREKLLHIATSDESGAWCATVYYANIGTCFYFYSSKRSIHIKQALKTKNASAVISHETDKWQEIEGAQMKGIIEEVVSLKERINASRTYLHKFPFVKEYFVKQKLKGRLFSEKILYLRLYVFRAKEIHYVSNRNYFGQRFEIDLALLE